MELTWELSDGGRRDAGFKGKSRDCVCRAIAIATEGSYRSIYNELTQRAKSYAASHNNKTSRNIERSGPQPNTGVHKEIYTPYLTERGWQYVSLGSNRGSLSDVPLDTTCIVRYPKHLTVLKDRAVWDNHDPRYTYFYGDKRERKVLGYFFKPSSEQKDTA